MSLGEEVVEDYVSMRLTLRAHPMAFLRHKLTPGTKPLQFDSNCASSVEKYPGGDSQRLSGAEPQTPPPRRLTDAKGTMRTDVWGEVGNPTANRSSTGS
jgi:hypothetical protein